MCLVATCLKKKSNVVETPTITPSETSQDLNTGITVTLACDTEDATIHYTIDGTEVTAESPTYSTGISISGKNAGENVTVKAMAVKDGMTNSEVAEITYINSYVQTRAARAKKVVE